MPAVALASTRTFHVSLLVFGALLIAGALLSGLARESFLSLSALFVLVGFALGHGGLGVLTLKPARLSSATWP